MSGHLAEGLAPFRGPGLLVAPVLFGHDTPAAELLPQRPEENLPGTAAGYHLALDQGLGQRPDQRPVGGKQILDKTRQNGQNGDSNQFPDKTRQNETKRGQ